MQAQPQALASVDSRHTHTCTRTQTPSARVIYTTESCVCLFPSLSRQRQARRDGESWNYVVADASSCLRTTTACVDVILTIISEQRGKRSSAHHAFLAPRLRLRSRRLTRVISSEVTPDALTVSSSTPLVSFNSQEARDPDSWLSGLSLSFDTCTSACQQRDCYHHAQGKACTRESSDELIKSHGNQSRDQRRERIKGTQR